MSAYHSKKQGCFVFGMGMALAVLATACMFDPGGAEVTSQPQCGNGVLESGEECDGDALGGATCESLGLEPGVLLCAADCTYDTAGCGGGVVCGNGIQEAGEQCDGADLGETTCTDLGYTGGTLDCNADCTYDETQCERPEGCGDGEVAGDEECDDGNNSNTDACLNTCVQASCGDGYVWDGQEECDDGGWTSSCDLDCTVAECGDGTVNGSASEECDAGGETADCDADCTAVWCNDGVLNTTAGEVCDGTDLGGETCQSQNFYSGDLACGTDCTAFDTSQCSGTCGDGIINGPEVCDGTDLGGETCVTQGFFGGTLACGTGCTAFDTAQCEEPPLVLITEVGLGAPDTVEILNLTGGPLELENWSVQWFGYDGNTPEQGEIELPAYSLNDGERTYLADDYEGDGSPPEVIDQRIQAYVNIYWGDYAGAAVLRHPNGQPVDFVRWGDDTFAPPDGAVWAEDPDYLVSFYWNRWTLSRVPEDGDNDVSADFCIAGNTVGDTNGLCVQFPGKGAVLINEVDAINGDDRIELYNPGNSPVQLGKIVLHWTSGSSIDQEDTYPLPFYELAGGDYVVLIDDVNDDNPMFIDGAGIHIYNLHWADYEVSCALETVLGGVDFVRWGGSSTEPRAPDTWTDNPALPVLVYPAMARDPDVGGDNDNSGDWCLAEPTFGGPNQCVEFAQKGDLLISEIDVGSPDRIELYNSTNQPIQLGYVFLRWTSGGGTPDNGVEILPEYELAPQSYVVVADDSSEDIRVANINWANYWSGACAIETEQGGVDFVRWGGSSTDPLAPDTWSDSATPLSNVSGGTMGRDPADPDGDTDDVSDWCEAAPSFGSANNACD